MAIAAEESIKRGYGGAAYGFASSMKLVRYYEDKFGAEHVPIEHPYEIIYSETAMKKLLEVYHYERRN